MGVGTGVGSSVGIGVGVLQNGGRHAGVGVGVGDSVGGGVGVPIWAFARVKRKREQAARKMRDAASRRTLHLNDEVGFRRAHAGEAVNALEHHFG